MCSSSGFDNGVAQAKRLAGLPRRGSSHEACNKMLKAQGLSHEATRGSSHEACNKRLKAQG